MGQRRHHYERAFEGFLRDQRMPYICVNEAKKALLPQSAKLELSSSSSGDPAAGHSLKIKNFDFVVYGRTTNLIVEIKGRRLPAIRLQDGTPAKPRMESWVTLDDIESLKRWKTLFGESFDPVFVFVYWCDDVPPDGLFVETVEQSGRWYTLRAVRLQEYERLMKTRSPRWRTVHLAKDDFDSISRPFGGFDIPRLHIEKPSWLEGEDLQLNADQHGTPSGPQPVYHPL